LSSTESRYIGVRMPRLMSTFTGPSSSSIMKGAALTSYSLKPGDSLTYSGSPTRPLPKRNIWSDAELGWRSGNLWSRIRWS